MATDVDERRELARAFWQKREVICPRHGAPMRAIFVESTYFDHIAVDCPKGRETYTIPQRPKQVVFNPHQIEGFVVYRNRGDNILCYRCQAKLQVAVDEDASTGVSKFMFTCVRCLSWGTWEGRPQDASIEGVSAEMAK